MTKTDPSYRKPWLLKGACAGIFIVVLLAALYSYYHVNKTSLVDKLTVVAELSAENIRRPLIVGDIAAIDREIAAISKKYMLDGAELYSSDGSMLVEFGHQKGQPPTSLMLGEHLCLSWPFLLMTRYASIVFIDDRPLGLLILYQAMSANVVAGSIVLLLFLLLLLQRTEAKSFFAGKRLSSPALLMERRKRLFADEEALEKLVRRRTAELERQRDQALLSARAKGDFLANMSHEIRTTMNGVVGVLSLLQESGFSGEKKRLLDVAVRSADSLLLVINDILDFSKIESKKMDFERICFDLREIVEECISLYIDTARSKGIRLHCYLPLEISTRVVGDPTRLRQIITNLLSNAVKFTDVGEVSFRVGLITAGQQLQELRFVIEDTGIGIEEHKIDGLFDMFTQAETDTTRKYGGTGLGLNVCKKLVELQGGEIGVSSASGQGATFWFTMSFEIAADNSERDVPVDKKIALFDNCETCSTIILQYLRGCTLRNGVGGDARDILAQLRQLAEDNYIPEILLIDYSAIGDDVEMLIDELAAVFDHPPELFVLTHLGDIEQELKAKGVAGVILKPVRLIQLHEQILGSPPREEIATAIRVEVGGTRVLVVDDEHINRHVGQMILEKMGFEADVAADGEEAIRKIAENRYDVVLMDIQMPGVDGLETTRRIRRRERSRDGVHLPILAMTANALPAIKDRCLAVGMDGFLTKPIKPETLFKKLRPYFPDVAETVGSPELRASGRKTGSLSQPAGNEVWDRRRALEYLGGDEDLLADLARLFIARKELLLGALEVSMHNGNGEEISSAAHAFKGAVNHFAAGPCQNLALAIESKAGSDRLDGLEEEVEKLKMAAEVLVEELEKQI